MFFKRAQIVAKYLDEFLKIICYQDRSKLVEYCHTPSHTCSGQSYKHFTIVIYDPRVVIWGVFKSVTTLES